MDTLRKSAYTLCLILGISLLSPAGAFASSGAVSMSAACIGSVWELQNYPPSSVLDAHAISDVLDCSDENVCDVEVTELEPLNLAPFSGQNAHSIAEDRQAAHTLAENFAPWSTRDAHSRSLNSVASSDSECTSCAAVHGFGANTTTCNHGWDCEAERIDDARIPIEVLRQMNAASIFGC